MTGVSATTTGPRRCVPVPRRGPERARLERDGFLGLAYDGRPGTIAAARDAASAFLTGVGGAPLPREAAGDVELVVSELVTNACRHAPGPCRLELSLGDGWVEVAVSDTGSGVPVPHEPDATRVGRHGLEIVTALCGGVAVERGPGGKRVSARVPVLPFRPRPGKA